MAGHQRKCSKKAGVTIRHAVNRRGALEGCIVRWVEKKGRTGHEGTLVAAMEVFRGGVEIVWFLEGWIKD